VTHLLEVKRLSARYYTPGGVVRAVDSISYSLDQGETLGLVGESGCGKSASALCLLRLLPDPPGKIVGGEILFDGRDLLKLGDEEMRKVRWSEIAMVFQDPLASLNPVLTIGFQIQEVLRLHEGMTYRQSRDRARELLGLVGIPDPGRRLDQYPHEFSGGMRQRAMIAMALACDPKLLIADEPTTALDVTVQAQIVDLVRELQAEYRLAVVWITHDLGVVAEIADRVAVMYAGRILETGQASDLYRATRHPYTSGLLRSIPRLDRSVTTRLAEIPGAPVRVVSELAACPFDDRCPLAGEGCQDALPELEAVGPQGHRSACIHHHQMGPASLLWPEGTEAGRQDADQQPGDVVVSIRDLRVHFPIIRGMRESRKRAIRAVDGVSLDVVRGKTLGIVGESGCGKTTLGRAMVALVRPTGGTIEINGEPINHRSGRHRKVVQMIFQDPFSAMNPGMRVSDVIAEPLRIHRLADADAIRDRVTELLIQVGLPPDAGTRYPHEFSGGQRQRIAVARALAADPEVVVCDEPVSSLDVSVQAQVINLLADLQARTGMAMVFIAHDLAVVRHVSHDVGVMYLGEIVEKAPRDQLYEDPLHPYTKALLEAVPVPEPDYDTTQRTRLVGDVPSPADPPAGCRFHTRCPVAVEGLCSVVKPELEEVTPGRWVSCHLVNPPAAASGFAH